MHDSLLTGDNAAFVDTQYQSWLQDPASVEPQLASLFASFEWEGNGVGLRREPSFKPRSIFSAGRNIAARADLVGATRQAKVAQLINAYRVRGHLKANIDPLDRKAILEHPELTHEYWGLSESDLDAVVPTAPVVGMPHTARLRDLIRRLDVIYCGSVGAEFMNINDREQKHWVITQLETLPDRHVLDREEELRILRKLCDAENFERMLHTRFPGTKRFSLEGAETLIPLLDLVISHAGREGMVELVFGMAHRGRLNALCNILEKPASLIVSEFQGVYGTTQGSGDVKYHLGYSSDTVTVHGHKVHLSLTPNPSHLEAVDPVVVGRVRAKQDRALDLQRSLAMPVILHGDAAFAGQGLVQETLNFSETAGYRVGGSLHIIVNNQIGFTTTSAESRSTLYATDVARMLAIPIFHVNGEDPRAVAAVVEIAVKWRQRFKRDVVIDMYCYRKHGHNEGDEPSFTQPRMYEVIRSRPTPREVYAQRLVELGDLTQDDVDRIHKESFSAMLAESEPHTRGIQASDRNRINVGDELKEEDPDLQLYFDAKPEQTQPAAQRNANDVVSISPAKGLWNEHSGGTIRDRVDTTVPLDRLRELIRKANTCPEGFRPHRKVRRLLKQRLEIADGERPVDWAVGEQAAYATLLDAGYLVRLSGEDVARGTFSHRHAVLTDVESGKEFYPLDHLSADQGRFGAFDSLLSEFGVLGFEVGYALDTPDGLVIWEAQFGDFANGAQVIIDQFISSSEQKWQRFCGIVLFLPHGFEGQGPEHSSARLERWLQLCGDDNLQVANVTTPANLFHMLRQQVLRRVRKPLIVMTPKRGLRLPAAVSTLEELAQGRFEPVLTDESVDPARVERLVLCSGAVYFDLDEKRKQMEQDRVAIVRVEMIHPWPQQALDELLDRYPAAEVVWCQEEPKNMGAWPMIFHWMFDGFPRERLPRYIGRRPAASPATGVHSKHVQEQTALVTAALTLKEG